MANLKESNKIKIFSDSHSLNDAGVLCKMYVLVFHGTESCWGHTEVADMFYNSWAFSFADFLFLYSVYVQHTDMNEDLGWNVLEITTEITWEVIFRRV